MDAAEVLDTRLKNSEGPVPQGRTTVEPQAVRGGAMPAAGCAHTLLGSP
jgi:hypothetical protein